LFNEDCQHPIATSGFPHVTHGQASDAYAYV